MAQIVKGKENQLKKVLRRSFYFQMICFFGIFLSVMLSMYHLILGSLTLSIFIFFLNKYYLYFKLVQSGLSGEKKALKLVKKLPKSYYVLSDIEITFEGKTSQLDHVIIGPNGIFVIETKNISGYIKGEVTDHDWKRTKISRKGNEFHKTFYNPVKQVSTHVYRLSKFLESYGIHSWVQGVVYFSNPDSVVYVKGKKVPIFSRHSGNEKLLLYLQNYQHPTVHKTGIDCKKIVSILKKQ